MSIDSIKGIYDSSLFQTFPVNSGFYTTSIDINGEVRQDNLPLGITVPEVTVDRQTKVGLKDVHMVNIPYKLIPAVDLTLNIIDERDLPPLAEEREKPPKHLYATFHENDFWIINVTVTPENKDNVWFRAIRIQVTNKATKVKRRIKIPWIHLPMFKFYFEKMANTLMEYEDQFDAKYGSGACAYEYNKIYKQ